MKIQDITEGYGRYYCSTDKKWKTRKGPKQTRKVNEFAPGGFNGGDDGEEFNPNLAKMAYDEGVVKGASLADGATLERAMAINDWDKHDGGIYSQHFAKGFIAGRKDKIRHNNKQYNLNLQLMKDGSIRHGEQGVAEGWFTDLFKKKQAPVKLTVSVEEFEQKAKSWKKAMLTAYKKIPELIQLNQWTQVKATASKVKNGLQKGINEGYITFESPEKAEGVTKRVNSALNVKIFDEIKVNIKPEDFAGGGTGALLGLAVGGIAGAAIGGALGSSRRANKQTAQQLAIANAQSAAQHKTTSNRQDNKEAVIQRITKFEPTFIKIISLPTKTIPNNPQPFNGSSRIEPTLEQGVAEEKTRLDPKCWDGYKKDGTKMKGGVRVNNCVKEELEETYDGDEFFEAYGELWYNEDEQLDEAEYQGRNVPLGKPMQGDVKKFKVYVKDPSTGNVKKVNFGDPDMKIRKSNPAARRSFRARHNCDNPGPRTKARYWSCRKW